MDAVKSYICTTNWTAVYNEIVTDLDIEHIMSQVRLRNEVQQNETGGLGPTKIVNNAHILLSAVLLKWSQVCLIE